ncbi:MAG: DUF2064 domain-containing protein [Blastocatellales bacterium]
MMMDFSSQVISQALAADSAGQAERRAVLVFADALAEDLARRRWPESFQPLLQTQTFDAEWGIGADVHFFTAAGNTLPDLPASITIHAQQGAAFAERLENAVETLAGLGYTQVVIVGRDCPDLEAADIERAFEQLDDHKLVLGPDHRGGCYLIALYLGDRARLNGICWQQNTDCAELTRRFGSDQTALLPVKLDLDSVADIRLLTRSTSRWRYLAAELLRSLASGVTPFLFQPFISSQAFLRVLWQLPPPSDSSHAITA